ncbi:hypothetical protein EDB81DRAFT_787465 [Dactylonectria macrodidyma]|uniref:Zn(2)-C6 fungal-type domain-containing protein n=1 Tax=Dactylonectria macrodidyma TaxID=307937 RepID=A0A9P9FA44_9HYPO|nr:hypothetical protein EDB81DRAFT_787465 [Dactylonectria macrodidyma]
MATEKEKPTKWTRAKAPRVRTGCEKPTCRRCTKDGHVCDGYEVVFGRKPKSKTKETKTKDLPPRNEQLVLRNRQPVTQVSLCPGLAFDVSRLPTEIDLFHHFRTSTIQDLASALTPIDFWHIHALPLGHAVEPIKYALCALGGAHRHFKTRALGNSTGGLHRFGLEEISIQQYNRAIQHIKSFTRTSSRQNLEVILTCCVIFICIENLLGRYSESLRHLQAGCALLSTVRKLSIPDSPGLRISVQQDEETGNYTFFDDIAAMLSRLGQDMSMYVGNDVIPELYFYAAPPTGFPDPARPFDSSSSAARLLFNIETEYSARLYIAEREWLRSPEYDGREIPPYWDDDTKLPEDDKFQVLALEKVYDDWSVRFDLYKNHADRQTMTKQELHQMSMLSIGQALWSGFTTMKSTDEEIDRDVCERVLQRVEELIRSDHFEQQPVFSFDANVIPALTFVCTSCNDFEIQWKCVRMLRSIWRREGIWDSQEMADILESMVMARERGLISWKGLPWQIPQLARLVSKFGLTPHRISTGAMGLAARDVEDLGMAEELAV